MSSDIKREACEGSPKLTVENSDQPKSKYSRKKSQKTGYIRQLKQCSSKIIEIASLQLREIKGDGAVTEVIYDGKPTT